MSTDSFIFATTTIDAIIITIGTIGNAISIIVFSRKTFRNNSISTYCIALAIFDSLALIEFITDIGYLAYGVNLADKSDAFCKISFYFSTILNAIQPCILVVFSIDKLFSMKTRSIAILKKKWFQWSIVAGMVVFNVLLYLAMPILLKRREDLPGVYVCDVATIGFLNILMIVYLLESCMIPFIVMSVSSILTIRLLIKSRNSVERSGKLSKERRSRDAKYAISSVTFNVLFFIFKLPLVVYFSLAAFFTYSDAYFLKIATLLFFSNASIGFYVHIVTNSLFRKEFFSFFRFMKYSLETSAATNSRSRINPLMNQMCRDRVKK